MAALDVVLLTTFLVLVSGQTADPTVVVTSTENTYVRTYVQDLPEHFGVNSTASGFRNSGIPEFGILTSSSYPVTFAPKDQDVSAIVSPLFEDQDAAQVGYGPQTCKDVAKAQEVTDATSKVFSTTGSFATAIGLPEVSAAFGVVGSLFSVAGALCGLFGTACPKENPAVTAIKAATAHLDQRFDGMEAELGQLKSDIAAVWLEKFVDMNTRMKLRRQYFAAYNKAPSEAARNDFINQYTRIEQGGAFDQDFVTFHDCFTGDNVYCSIDSKVTLFDKVETVVQHRPQPLMVWASNYQLMMQQGLIAECAYDTALKIQKNGTGSDYNCTAANGDVKYTQSLATFMHTKVTTFKQKMWDAMSAGNVQCGADNDEFCPLAQIISKYETSQPGNWNSTVLSDIATDNFHEMYNNWEYDATKKDGLYWIGDIISVMIGGQTDFYAIQNQKRNTLYRKFSAGSRKLTQLLSVIDMSQYPNGYPGPQFKPQVTMRSCINGYVNACNKQHCKASPEDIANFIKTYCMNPSGFTFLYVQKMTVDVGEISTTGGHVQKYLKYLTIGGHDVNIFLM